MTDPVVLVDDPAPHVRRITMNRPEKRNALNHPLRGAILDALREARRATRRCACTIVRGAGPSFSAGYDLGGGNEGQELPYYTPGGDGHWPRHVTEGWMSIWDLAQARDRAGARLLPRRRQRARHRLRPRLHRRGRADGLPGRALRRARHALPRVVPRHAQGDGDDADGRLDLGRRGRAARLGERARSRRRARGARCSRWRSASRSVPPDLVQLNKRVVHRQMEIMGMRTGIRVGTELCALGTHQKSMHEFIARVRARRASPARCKSATRPSATTAPRSPRASKREKRGRSSTCQLGSAPSSSRLVDKLTNVPVFPVPGFRGQPRRGKPTRPPPSRTMVLPVIQPLLASQAR